MDKAKDQGCAALIALGARGFSFATNLILSTAAKVAHDTHCNISIVMLTIVALKWCSEVEVCIIHLYKIFLRSELLFCASVVETIQSEWSLAIPRRPDIMLLSVLPLSLCFYRLHYVYCFSST